MYSHYPCTCHLESGFDKFVLYHPMSPIHPSVHLTLFYVYFTMSCRHEWPPRSSSLAAQPL